MASVMSMGDKETGGMVELVETYGDEVMYAGWNPQLASACERQVATGRQNFIPPSLAEAEINAFLQKMYACQR